MKRTLTVLALSSFALLVAYCLPVSPHNIVEGGQLSPFVQVASIKAQDKPVQAILSHLEPVGTPAPVIAPKTAPTASVSTYTTSGDQYLDWIIQHESSGNPYAVNEIGACGLYQALPCSKMGCRLSDVPCQLVWGKQYAISRYGSTYAAMVWWQSHRWW